MSKKAIKSRKVRTHKARRRDPIPADHPTTVCLLKPNQGPLSLDPRDPFFDRPPTVSLALPNPGRVPPACGFCQVVEAETLIRQAGASPRSYPPFSPTATLAEHALLSQRFTGDR